MKCGSRPRPSLSPRIWQQAWYQALDHRLDTKPWKRRYPKAKVLCAPGARKAVEQVIAVDATTDVLDDLTVVFEKVPGVGEKEAALIVRRDRGTTLIVNDILANVRHFVVCMHAPLRLAGP